MTDDANKPLTAGDLVKAIQELPPERHGFARAVVESYAYLREAPLLEEINTLRQQNAMLVKRVQGVVVPTGWQPIETYDKEAAEPVILANPWMWEWCGAWHEVDNSWSEQWVTAKYEPTHWMPLPTPPESEGDNDVQK